jgi:flagellar basal body-associated protein FliL
MSLSKTLVLFGVASVSAAAGVAVPLVLNGGIKGTQAVADPASEPAEEKSEKKADDHSSHKSTSQGHAEPAAKSDKGDHGAHKSGAKGKDGSGSGESAAGGPQFVPFGRIVVNLNEPSLTKYLSLDITLLADPKDSGSLKDAVEGRLPILRTWLTSHLADKSMEDVRGKVGINRLRREIQDQFNALLFDDGRERVRDVLFEEFHVE